MLMCGTPTALRHANGERGNETTMPAEGVQGTNKGMFIMLEAA